MPAIVKFLPLSSGKWSFQHLQKFSENVSLLNPLPTVLGWVGAYHILDDIQNPAPSIFFGKYRIPPCSLPFWVMAFLPEQVSDESWMVDGNHFVDAEIRFDDVAKLFMFIHLKPVASHEVLGPEKLQKEREEAKHMKVNDGTALWVKTVLNRRIQFIDLKLFPMRSRRRE